VQLIAFGRALAGARRSHRHQSHLHVVPSSGGGGWLLDMATTTVAMNKVLKAVANEQPSIPPNWALDSDGFLPRTRDGAQRVAVPLGGYKGPGSA